MNINSAEDLAKKINTLKDDNKLDLSSGEDMSIAIMNLVSIEEHCFFSYGKSKDEHYLSMLNDARKMRTELLKQIVSDPDPEGEIWCISKHLLAASMRIMEVATKKLKSGEEVLAKNLFNKSFDLYSLFWGINLKLVGLKDVKSGIPENTVVASSEKEEKNIDTKGSSIFSKLGDVVKKVLDCCKE